MGGGLNALSKKGKAPQKKGGGWEKSKTYVLTYNGRGGQCVKKKRITGNSIRKAQRESPSQCWVWTPEGSTIRKRSAQKRKADVCRLSKPGKPDDRKET